MDGFGGRWHLRSEPLRCGGERSEWVFRDLVGGEKLGVAGCGAGEVLVILGACV